MCNMKNPITSGLKVIAKVKVFQHSGSIPRNACVACETAIRDYQENVTTVQTDAGQSDPYVPLCLAGDTKK